MTVPTPRKTATYGWVPDLPDVRDHLYAAPPDVLGNLPPSVDLRAQADAMTPIYDQGRIGSCTANAIAAAFEFDVLKQGVADFKPSRLFIYYNERRIEGDIGTDRGAAIRDGLKSVSRQGVCAEAEWPYVPTEAISEGGPWPVGAVPAELPPAACYTDALTNTIASYRRVVRSLPQLKGCLAHGYPFVLGFTVYESFESAKVAADGAVPLPGPGERVKGGHAVLVVGYDDDEQRFTCRNSWGPGWGDGGYFTLPYAYLTDRGLASDFWTIRTVRTIRTVAAAPRPTAGSGAR